MTLPYQFFCEIRNDPFGAAVELGRHAFAQGSDLSDFHQHNLLDMSEALTMKMRGRTAPRGRHPIYDRLSRVQYPLIPKSVLEARAKPATDLGGSHLGEIVLRKPTIPLRTSMPVSRAIKSGIATWPLNLAIRGLPWERSHLFHSAVFSGNNVPNRYAGKTLRL